MSSNVIYKSRSLSISGERLVEVSTSCAADLDDADVVVLTFAAQWAIRLDRIDARTLSRVLRGLLVDRETSFVDASTGELTHAKLDATSWTIGDRERADCTRQDLLLVATMIDNAAVDLGLYVDGPIIETDAHERKKARDNERKRKLKEEMT